MVTSLTTQSPSAKARTDMNSPTGRTTAVMTRQMTRINVTEALKTCAKRQFTGNLMLRADSGEQWHVYYRLGRIVWATGGTHPRRRWRRLMASHCPHIDVNRIQLRGSDRVQLLQDADRAELWEYQLLSILMKRHNITLDQAKAIITDGTIEVLFDVIQSEAGSAVQAKTDGGDTLDTSLALLNVEWLVGQVQDRWQVWQNAQLGTVSPNFAPVVCQPQKLQQAISAKAYKKLTTIANGRSTIRDIAFRLKQDPAKLLQSLMPYLRQGWIELAPIADLPAATIDRSAKAPQTQSGADRSHQPLIACIDDSPQNCKTIEDIVTDAGYRFMSVTDSVQALPALLEARPDFILLDLVMPVANGYEICSQIRRVSHLKQTPVVILTSQDSMGDRVRAKVVRASGFMSKPVNADKLLATIEKFVPREQAAAS